MQQDVKYKTMGNKKDITFVLVTQGCDANVLMNVRESDKDTIYGPAIGVDGWIVKWADAPKSSIVKTLTEEEGLHELERRLSVMREIMREGE